MGDMKRALGGEGVTNRLSEGFILVAFGIGKIGDSCYPTRSRLEIYAVNHHRRACSSVQIMRVEEVRFRAIDVCVFVLFLYFFLRRLAVFFFFVLYSFVCY